MIGRRFLLVSVFALTAGLIAKPAIAHSTKPIPVVSTFSILGDMVSRIGGDHISLKTLVGRDGDTHVYRPTPADARAVKEARVLFVNGLEFEGWMARLIDASGFDGLRVVATEGIEPIAYEDEHDDHKDGHDKHNDHKDDHAKHDDHKDDHTKHDDHKDDHDKHDDHKDDHAKHDDHKDDDHHGHDHGAFDPHAWQSLRLAKIYADNITAALSKVAPEHAADFYANRAAFVAELDALDQEIRDLFANLTETQRTVVTSHDAFQYFGRDYGLTFLAPQGLSTTSEASPKEVARLIEQIRHDNISAVFVENISDPRLIKQIANETGAAVGGTLYPGALSKKDGPASTYLEMMRHNATTLANALGAR
ncbi:zinc ABC transporter substrate-binding protein [bacterium]|nr:zinc ABC transporter substrate-binding protein [bacterium]